MGLIGCLLFNNNVYERVAAIVAPEMFLYGSNGRIFETIGKLLEHGTQADPRSLKNYFDQDNTFGDIGGIGYMTKLLQATITTVNAESYANNIRDLWLRRRVIDVSTAALNEAYEFEVGESAGDQIDSLIGELSDLADQEAVNRKPTTLGEAVNDAIDQAAEAESRGTKIVGIRSGYHAIDAILGGFQPGTVIVLGGATSSGKTSLARCIAYRVAKAAHAKEQNAGPVLYFSFEMTARQMAFAIISPIVGIPTSDLMVGSIGDGHNWNRILEAQQELQKLPLHFEDKAGLTIQEMILTAKRIKRQGGLGLIVVDLLGRVVAPKEFRDSDRLHQIMIGLTRMAKQIDAPVIVLHQLSRKPGDRDDPRPGMSDLRDSGAIEQDADVVMFVYRPFYYLSRAEPKKRDRESDGDYTARVADWREDCQRCEHRGEIIVDKNRVTGPIGTANLFWDGRFAKFSNLGPDQAQETLL